MKKAVIIFISFLLWSLLINAQESFFTAGMINSNVTYTDIANDTIHGIYQTTVTYSIDINNDSQVDFIFTRFFSFSAGTRWDYLYLTPYNGSKVAIKKLVPCYNNQINDHNVGNNFILGDTLNSPIVIYKDTVVYIGLENFITGLGPCSSGTWNHLNNTYLGVEIIENNTPVHAWIRLGEIYYPDGNKVIVYDYCLNKSANGILTQNLANAILSISPNPFTTTTQITLPQTYHHIALALYNLQGKQLLQQSYTDTDKILLQRNHLNNGLYFLKLTLDGKWVETGKIVVSE